MFLNLWRYGKQLELEKGSTREDSFGMYPDVVKQVEMRSRGPMNKVKNLEKIKMEKKDFYETENG